MTLVSVVIPCYNQARFLSEAIESVLAQSYTNFEIIVVDDGSTDNTSEVATRYPQVRSIRQKNQGPSGARNSGLALSKGSCVVFLDADDRLLPDALKVGLECLDAHPECAFVCGYYRNIAADGSFLREVQQPLIGSDFYVNILSSKHLVTTGSVMHRRSALETVGGFDASIKAGEDYDLYFRLVREFPVYWHNNVVVEIRRHDTNTTSNYAPMLKAMTAVLRSQRKYVKKDTRYKEAYKAGIRTGQDGWGLLVAREVLDHMRDWEWKQAAQDLLVLLQYHPRIFVDPRIPRTVARAFRRRILSTRLLPWLRRTLVGRVRFGNLRRVTPISRYHFVRGQPIDRYYIENFLARHTGDIKGRVLEVGSASYTRRYGGERVKISDVLHVTEGNPQATIVADLTHADHIPSDAFDCIILTQTLQLIYDVRSALQTLHRILKPGGVLLATFPGLSHIEQVEQDYEWKEWYWSFSTLSAQRLFGEVFPAANVEVEAHGNVLATICFLHAVAAEELRREELDYRDPYYELLLTLRAVKPEALL